MSQNGVLRNSIWRCDGLCFSHEHVVHSASFDLVDDYCLAAVVVPRVNLERKLVGEHSRV